MKKLALISLFFLLFLSACTQSKNVRKAYAYSQHITYGTVATDDKGNQLTPGSGTNKFIYLECKGAVKPKIKEINYNGIIYKTPGVSLFSNKEVEVGIKESDNKPILLIPAKGNTIWKIELRLPETQPSQLKGTEIEMEKPSESKISKIIIKGAMGRNTFILTIKNEIELRAIMGV